MWYTGSMNVGKLYQVKKLYWMIYPSTAASFVDTATAHDPVRCGEKSAATAAAYYSKYFNCNVSYISPNSIFCLLEKDGEFIRILSANGEVGWINLADWCKDDIEEITV